MSNVPGGKELEEQKLFEKNIKNDFYSIDTSGMSESEKQSFYCEKLKKLIRNREQEK